MTHELRLPAVARALAGAAGEPRSEQGAAESCPASRGAPRHPNPNLPTCWPHPSLPTLGQTGAPVQSRMMSESLLPLRKEPWATLTLRYAGPGAAAHSKPAEAPRRGRGGGRARRRGARLHERGHEREAGAPVEAGVHDLLHLHLVRHAAGVRHAALAVARARKVPRAPRDQRHLRGQGRVGLAQQRVPAKCRERRAISVTCAARV